MGRARSPVSWGSSPPHVSGSTMKLLLLLLVGAAASPLVDPNICGNPKCRGSGKFQYAPGTRYQYQYSVDVRTLFEGTSSNQSTLHVEAEVELVFVSQCEATLKVWRTSLSERGPTLDEENNAEYMNQELAESAAFSRAIAQHQLRFNFEDGAISQLCPEDGELSWVLNFKRGILSAFHNSMKRFDIDFEGTEEDVNGQCPTKYQLSGADETSLSIHKTKELTSCTGRYKHHTILQTTPYIFRSNYQAPPVMRSSAHCKLAVDHNVYTKIDCEERHVFRAFSGATSGATTITSQALTLFAETNVTLDEDPEMVMRRTSLLFDHDLTPKPTTGELKASRDLVKAMCRLADDDIHREFPNVFTQFIHTARLLSSQALSQLFSRANGICSTGRKHVTDALPLLGSNAAVAVVMDLVQKGRVPQETVQEWLFLVSFLPRPDASTVRLVVPLLKSKKADTQHILTVSSVVHSYCRRHPDCWEEPHISDVVEGLLAQVAAGCAANRDDRASQEKLVVALKALGNMGIATESLRSTFWKCIEDTSLPTEVRIAAIEAHRRMPCEGHRDYFLEKFRDETLDPELRISSYLEVMKCPTYIVIKTIKHSLSTEQVNQVGSFVWSHLENLLHSSIPSRVEIQGLLQDHDLGRKFSRDVRKYSHNFEGSVFLDEYNAGGNFESNVIFSPKSYIPRSAMLNFTLDLFGESINVFEVSARMEGFEHYVESVFGPKRPLSAQVVKDRVQSYLRFARSPPRGEDALPEQVHNLTNVVAKNRDSPQVKLGFKIFGNEFSYKTFIGTEEIMDALSSMNPVNRIQQILSGKEINFSKAMLLLDTNYIVPTGVGLPISLNAVGTGAVNLVLSGLLKASDFLTNKHLDIESKIQPSVALDLVGTMSVDAYYASTTIKLKTNLYTSTAFEGQLKVRGTRLVSLNFNLPKNKAEIFTAESELIVVRGEEEEPQIGITEGRTDAHICSWTWLDKTLGLQFCGDLQFPNASLNKNASDFILNGPTKFSLSLQKADPTAKRYLLEYKWESNDDVALISLVFDTPGSNVKREVSARLNLDKNSQNLTLVLNSGQNTYTAVGNYKNEENDQFISIRIISNGERSFDALVGLTRTEEKHGFSYLPRLYIVIRNDTIVELKGSLKWVEKRGVSQCEVNLQFDTKQVKTNLYGYVQQGDALLSVVVVLNYTLHKQPREHIRLEAQLNNKPSTGRRSTEMKGGLELECSAYPHLNFISAFKYLHIERHMDLVVEMNAGPHMKDERNKLTLHLELIDFKAYDGNKMSASLQITKPISNIDVKMSATYSVAGATVIFEVRVKYATEKEVVTTLKLSFPRRTRFSFQGHLNVSVPLFTPMILNTDISEKENNDYELNIFATWFTGSNFTVEGFYQDRSTVKAVSHSLKLLVSSSTFSDVVLIGKLYDSDTEFKLSVEADQNNNKYAVILKHATISQDEFESYIDVWYKDSIYSATTAVSFFERKQLKLELHLDKYRDIHLLVRALSRPELKAADFEVKWDANRDPGQKFSTGIEFVVHRHLNYSTSFVVSFPGRNVHGGADVSLTGMQYASSAHVEWSPQDAIHAQTVAVFEREDAILLQVSSQLRTPFPHWRSSKVVGGFLYKNNSVQANGTVEWQDNQRVSVGMYGKYFQSETDFHAEFNTSVSSSIAQVSSMSANFFHKHKAGHIDTNIYMQYRPEQTFGVRSTWEVEDNEACTNVSGAVVLLTPYDGYRRGNMVCALAFTEDWDISGVADVNIDKKKFTLSAEGHLKELTNSMLVFNLSTPIHNYTQVQGRFGYSEAEKHLVAEITSPYEIVGVEVILDCVSFTDFDVKLSFAPGLEFLNRTLLVAALNREKADFRVGFNSLMIGFTGVSHFANFADLEYTCKVYTPLQGFEESGGTLRVVYTDKFHFDIECGAHITDIKLGVKLHAADKPRMYKELPRQLTAGTLEEKLTAVDSGDDYDYYDEEDEEEAISWAGLVEVDTVLYPTMHGHVDVDQKGPLYIVAGSLTLPDGTAELYDEFSLVNFFDMSNRLELTTPCPCFKEFKERFKFYLGVGGQIHMMHEFRANIENQWHELGLVVNHTYEVMDDAGSAGTRSVAMKLFTPFDAIRTCDLAARVFVNGSSNSWNVTITTTNSSLACDGEYQKLPGYISWRASAEMDTPTYLILPIGAAVLLDVSSPVKQVDVRVSLLRPEQKLVILHGSWEKDVGKLLRASGSLETPLPALANVSASVVYVSAPESGATRLAVQASYLRQEVVLNGSLEGSELVATVQTPFHNLRNGKLSGTLTAAGSQARFFRGTFTEGDARSEISGDVRIVPDKLLQVSVVCIPEGAGYDYQAQLLLEKTDGGYAASCSLVNPRFTTYNASSVLTLSSPTDWNMDVEVSQVEDGRPKRVLLDGYSKFRMLGIDDISAEIDAVSDIKHLERVKFEGIHKKASKTGMLKTSFEVAQNQGEFDTRWSWYYMENMGLSVLTRYQSESTDKHARANVFYRNPRKSFKQVSLGYDINLNRDGWQAGANGSMAYPSTNNLSVTVNLKLPPPGFEIHSLHGEMQYTNNYSRMFKNVWYQTHSAKAKYELTGEVVNTGRDVDGFYRIEWGADTFKAINNILNVTRDGELVDIAYTLRTMEHEEDAFVVKLFHNRHGQLRSIRANVFCPASNPFMTAHVDFSSFANMNGTVMTDTPFMALSHLGAKFRTLTQLGENQRYVEAFWPNNTAVLDSKYTYDQTDTETSIVGSAVVEIPVTTRHIAKIEYNYKEKPYNTLGYAAVEYNGNTFLETKYKCDSQSSAGLDKDVVDIEVENGFTPVGIFYIHQFEYSAGSAGSNLPTTDKKHVEVFKLRDKESFNLTGELDVRSFLTGKNITFKAFHVDKMAKLSTEYEYLDHEYRQRSRCDLSPSAWASYDIKILNKTTDDKKEEHVELDILYPRRDFSVRSYYQLSKYSFSSEVSLAWDKVVKAKSLGASLDWKRLNDEQNRQHAVISIKHPSFKKDVTLNMQYKRNSKDVVDLSSNLIYSLDNRKNFLLTGSIQDNSIPPLKKYDLAIVGSHPETHLDMKLNSDAQWDGSLYHARGTAHYKRTYLPLQKGELLALLDKGNKQFEFEKKTLRELSFLKAKFDSDYPVYTLTGALKNGTSSVDATALFYIDLSEKLVEGTVNFTPEATENFRMHGKIPDARNAAFNAWRNYEDASISDASFYLRLNHSHLVTSRMVWRPEISSDMKTLVEAWVSAVLTSFMDSVDYWKVYVRSETREAINDIWLDAKSEMQPFLDDFSELHVLTDDLEELKAFLNESYYANDFYMQDVVQVFNFLMDEFSLRGHIDSVPVIVNEIWMVMGDSGEAAHRSVLWIVETCKDTYKKIVDYVQGFLKGDSAGYISAILDDIVEKYDKFMKDIHVSFVKQLEDFWSTMSETLQNHWNTFLEIIEPTFIHAIHYLETLVWNTSREIMAFLYKQKHDIVESVYFTQIANLTQDIDAVYRDIKKNDMVTNIKKYSKLIFKFVKEKFSLVPFGKELEQILSEIICEFRELQKLPSVQYAMEAYSAVSAKVMWVYEYLDLGNRLQYAVALLHSKLTDTSQTALQAENRYREAKTKFIFDPENGRVELEQKLPMSWHAFNETPKFEEIPEYKMITSVPSFLAFSNVTFWTLYYEYKPYTEPTNWLPPFRSQALLAGPQQFMTFDKRFFQFRGSCSYLLANDFVDYNFSLIVSYDSNEKKRDQYEIALIVEKDIIQINLFEDSVVVQRQGVKKLPAQLKDTYVYQEAEMVYIENSNGFTIQCNMKFDVCTFILEGWYFGKTAGLLGTMDNEPSNDFLASSGAAETDLGRFARSWAVEPRKCTSDENLAFAQQGVDPTVANICHAFFQSKTSEFITCFPVLDPAPFLHMCVNSRGADTRDPCTAAMAYMQACLMEDTPLRIPDVCVRCRDVGGKELVEGNFQKLENESVPQSSDVVFILEGKECNRDAGTRRSLDTLLAAVDKELGAAGLSDNRYGLVVYGGSGVYDQPRSIVIGNRVFATVQQFGQYFDDIPIGAGSNDTFGAIRYAARLMFRPGVSKTFILLLCSNCDANNMTLDYTVLHQVLLESDITLHIIMNGMFKVDKAKFNKVFYGIDTSTAFTKNDVKQLKGSTELRRQVKMPKSQIGLCAPLALETNGTIFSVRKLESGKKKAAKKMATVFARRLALTAAPGECQTCECTADNNGMSFMECFPCQIPAPSYIDYDEFISDDEDLGSMMYDEDEE